MLNKVADNAAFKIVSDIRDIDGIFENEAEISIYRIIQESLNNILKHAAATEVLVSIKPTEQTLLIKISDNGSGFDMKEKSEN
jgi:signal transduction histidine kinase